ncbi:hypothetical protein G5V57_00015 [Nordella sp. HKS 07]|uniref:hypothetical protein n=1 Tax=Nordella sp. HKS 07 TaxID=2712222 RepID=UPI0013E1305E|nr:hypothetical protein [Nordella sp. HKS 07]QIG46286.1 hypothetical protein G5V57_00015 [Nordella sp. HKS 07]
MVSAGPSRPVPLTQRQVDELARGGSSETMSALRAGRMAQKARPRPVSGSAPVGLSDQEMQAIRRESEAPAAIGQRIAAAKRVVKKSVRGKAKSKSPRRPEGKAPSLKPPYAVE